MNYIVKKISPTIFLLFIISMNHWIGWGIKIELTIALGILLFMQILMHKVCIDLSIRNITAVVLFYIGHLFFSANVIHNYQSVITQIPTFLIPLTGIMCLSDDYKIEVFKKITKWFAWLMIPAIILYFITLVMPLPSFGIVEWGEASRHSYDEYGICYNYLFLVKEISSNLIISRFSGPFLEPGHLGMMCAFILLANRHDYNNRYNRIILATLLITLSLAGWILGLIGFLICRYDEGRFTLKRLVLLICSVWLLILLGQNYNGGNNIINESIISRLELNEEGKMSGDNRQSEYTDILMAAMFKDPHLLWFGYDIDFINRLNEGSKTAVVGAGIRIDLVRHGLLAILLMLFAYYYLSQSSANKRFGYLLFIFLLLVSFQRFYPSWLSWIICYMMALINSDRKRNKYESIS